jgi:hypothetical protein
VRGEDEVQETADPEREVILQPRPDLVRLPANRAGENAVSVTGHRTGTRAGGVEQEVLHW